MYCTVCARHQEARPALTLHVHAPAAGAGEQAGRQAGAGEQAGRQELKELDNYKCS